MAGKIVAATAARGRGEIRPIDSEHSAIWQCLRGEKNDGQYSRLILTASGGAFRDKSPDELRPVTPEQALRHPTWQMGRKITVDSATLLNKGLEAIEARWLFDVPLGQDRDRDAPGERRPFAGGVRGRLAEGPARPARHAAADPVCPLLPRAACPALAAPSRPEAGKGRSTSRSWTCDATPVWGWRWRRAAAAAPIRPCSPPPTRWRSSTSSPVASVSPISRGSSRRRWTRTTARPDPGLEEMLGGRRLGARTGRGPGEGEGVSVIFQLPPTIRRHHQSCWSSSPTRSGTSSPPSYRACGCSSSGWASRPEYAAFKCGETDILHQRPAPGRLRAHVGRGRPQRSGQPGGQAPSGCDCWSSPPARS